MIEEYSKNIEKLKKEYEETLKREGKIIFNECIKMLFDNLPTLKKIMFVGYTPSFNDGDPCYYRHLDTSYCFEENKEIFEDSESEETLWRLKSCTQRNDIRYFFLKDKIEIIEKYNLDKFPDEFYEKSFGDGVKVYITRDKDKNIVIETEDYYPY